MADSLPDAAEIDRAKAIVSTFRLSEGVYLLGSLEKGVTVYSQQVRAHNLAWALWVLNNSPPGHRPGCRNYNPNNAITGGGPSIAIIGAGIAGLTTAACIMSLLPQARITLFERTWDLCPLQLGCDSRWLHPRIYTWPLPGSRAPSASLPLLTWQEGRASDVAHQVLTQFAGISREHKHVSFFIGVDYLRISATSKSIEWVGRQGIRRDQYIGAGDRYGGSGEFDAIVLAAGFGLETPSAKYQTPSYWRPDRLAEPTLDGSTRSFIVSGYGDGGVVDLCRLTVERFRQDRIIDDLFGADLEKAEAALLGVYESARKGANIYDELSALETTVLKRPLDRLSERIRKDTRVVFHVSGRKDSPNSAIRDVFGPSSSFLNRLLVYLLYRSGAFAPSFDHLEKVVDEYLVPPDRIVCRHGTQTTAHIERLFSDSVAIQPFLKAIGATQGQSNLREWRPGVFCNV